MGGPRPGGMGRIRAVAGLLPGGHDLGIPHLVTPLAFTFRDYDETAIDASALTGPPSLEGLPYEEKKRLALAGCTTNGSRTLKQGVEFTFSTPRIRPLATKLIVSGAYFRTDYENSEPQYISTSVVVTGGEPYPYIGLYDKEDELLQRVCATPISCSTRRFRGWG